MTRPEQLRRANLAYRDPALYDDMLADDLTAETIARLTAMTIGKSGRRSVLDLGCGTGRIAAALRSIYGWTTTGVDIQPELVAYANERDPASRWCTGDITTLNLDETFDVVTCVGNTLAYLDTSAQLTSAFHTASLHTAPLGLLIIATIDTAPPPHDQPQRAEIPTRHGPASVETRTTWEPHRHRVTTTRNWHFDNGTSEHDCYARHVWNVDQLRECAEDSGFQPLNRITPGITLAARRTQ